MGQVEDSIQRAGQVARMAMARGLATRVTDPAMLATLKATGSQTRGYDITPLNHADNNQTMYVVDGSIFVCVVGFAGPRFAEWYSVPAQGQAEA